MVDCLIAKHANRTMRISKRSRHSNKPSICSNKMSMIFKLTRVMPMHTIHSFPTFPFFLDLCALVISIMWILQIIIYVIPDPPFHPLLNEYFAWFDGWFPLFGTLSVAIFVVYLLLCAIKGCFKFGLRFMLVDLHPMRPGRTYMSSFMFNIGMVLLCALPSVQFAQEAFSEYARFTVIRQLFGIQVENLQFFNTFGPTMSSSMPFWHFPFLPCCIWHANREIKMP